MLDYETTLKLIDLAQSGDKKAKDELLINNIQLIKSIVKRYKYKQVEYDDLMQIGSIGLIKAIDHFDKSFNCKFSTYAVPMISGEIKRFIRDDGIIKVSRSIKQLNIKIQAFVNNYVLEYGFNPTIDVIANTFNMSSSDVVFTMDSSKYPVSIYEKTDDDSQCILDKIESNETNDDLVNNIMLKDFIEQLPLREKQVIILRYFRDKTQSEIAKILNVSQVQVSRIESKVIKDLKDKFNE